MNSHICFSVILSLFFTANCSANDHVIENEEQALQVLSDRLKADNVYPDGCVYFFPESESSVGFEIAVHEKHGDGCPGDPEVSPVRDRFAVEPTGRILWNDFSSGEYVDYGERKTTMGSLAE